MELTRRSFLAAAGAVAAGAACVSGVAPAWADEEASEAQEELAWKTVVCEGCPGGCGLR